MTYLVYLLAGIFLPLFPLSMIFNVLYARMRHPILRSLLLLIWPQIGLAIIFVFHLNVPDWIKLWSLLTALMYALRSLTLRELGLWTSFVGTSAWVLLWVLFDNGTNTLQLQLFALGISMPLLMMAILSAGLERRFGAAYLGLYSGLAHSIPRFTGVLVMVVLAVVATPLFPTFTAMLAMIMKTIPETPMLAVGVGIVWLLWSWSGARLLQGLIVGPQNHAVVDLSQTNLWLYIAVLIVLVFVGVYCLRALL
jgi:NADH:ubiquinone oxidoreductase subunit 4 (subunit M)